jgi:excisionase family DNA binding protein
MPRPMHVYKSYKENDEQIAYSPAQVARLLGMSDNGVRIAISRGQIPVARVGMKMLISRKWIEALLAGEVTQQKIAA